MRNFKSNKKSEKIYKFIYRYDYSYERDKKTMLVVARGPVEAVKKFNSKIPRDKLIDIKEFTELSFKTEESKEEG